MSDSIIGKQNLEIADLKEQIADLTYKLDKAKALLVDEMFLHEETRKQMQLL